MCEKTLNLPSVFIDLHRLRLELRFHFLCKKKTETAKWYLQHGMLYGTPIYKVTNSKKLRSKFDT